MSEPTRAHRALAPSEGGGPGRSAAERRQQAEAAARRLPPLLVAAERVAATVAAGVHGRRRVGTGESFWQFRRYADGDAAERIDWRQSAKGRHLYIRETEWEAAETVLLWRDRSASMEFRSARALPTKRGRADLLAMALAVLLVRGGEQVALIDERPLSGAFALARLADRLAREEALADRSLPPPVPLPRHAMLVMFGDFLDPPETVRAAIAAHAGRGVGGALVQILDPAEEDLPYDGRVMFTGLEGERSLTMPRVEAVREAYRQRLAAQRAELAASAGAVGWRFLTHRTDRPPHAALLSLYAAIGVRPR